MYIYSVYLRFGYKNRNPISDGAIKINFNEVIKDVLEDLSSKSDIYTFTINNILVGRKNDGTVLTDFTRSNRQNSTKESKKRFIGYFVIEKDKFNCLTILLEYFLTDHENFVYKTCRTLNSEPMMRYAFNQFVDHFGKKYKNKEDYNFRFKVS